MAVAEPGSRSITRRAPKVASKKKKNSPGGCVSERRERVAGGAFGRAVGGEQKGPVFFLIGRRPTVGEGGAAGRGLRAHTVRRVWHLFVSHLQHCGKHLVAFCDFLARSNKVP